MKSSSRLERVLTAGYFAVTSECGPPRGADPEAIRRKGELLRGVVDAVNVTDCQTAVVRMSSLSSCLLLKEMGFEPILQMVTRDRNRIAIQCDILGAAALGDIGELFPDTDPAHRGRDSAEMLREAFRLVGEFGWRVGNVDCIVFAQRPKLAPHKAAMRQRVAEILGLAPDRVGLKAKTGEGVGEIGREEVIAAQCVALLERV